MATRTLHRRPVPWPFRLLGWLVLSAALLGVLAFAALVGSATYYELTRTKAGDVEGWIAEDLRKGNSTDQVMRFLDERGITHGAVEPSAADDARLRDAEVPPGTLTITGTIRNDGYSLSYKDVVVTFVFNAEQQLEKWFVYEVDR